MFPALSHSPPLTVHDLAKLSQDQPFQGPYLCAFVSSPLLQAPPSPIPATIQSSVHQQPLQRCPLWLTMRGVMLFQPSWHFVSLWYLSGMHGSSVSYTVCISPPLPVCCFWRQRLYYTSTVSPCFTHKGNTERVTALVPILFYNMFRFISLY